MDGRNDKGEPIIMYERSYFSDNKEPLFKLGHSCDDWVIGTIDEARQFVKQLEAAIERAAENPTETFSNDD